MGDARLLMAAFRNNRIYTCHTVEVGNFRSACGVISVNIENFSKEIDVAIGRRDSYYHRPALQVAEDGAVLVVFNASDEERYIEARYMTRPAGSQFQTSRILKEGEGPYRRIDDNGRNRFGDYNCVAVDPAEPQALWFIAKYADSPRNTWGTWVGQARTGGEGNWEETA